MSQLRSFFSIFLLLIAVTAPSARADDATEARARYNEGRAAMEAGRYREAGLAFEAAVRLRQHGAAALAAATAWDKAEHPARAADNFQRAIELPGLSKKDLGEAKTRLEVLERSLGVANVEGPTEVIVQFDGSTEAHPPARLHALPGIQTLLVARDGKVERRDVMMKPGEVIEIDVTKPIEVTPPPAPTASASANAVEPPPPPPPPAKKHSTRTIIGYSAMGAGVVSLGVAIAMGIKTTSARDDFNANPTRENYDAATGARMWTNVAWAGAVVLGGAGAALVFYPWDKANDSAKVQVGISPAPGGLQVQGAF